MVVQPSIVTYKTALFANYEVQVIVMVWYYRIAPLPKAFFLCFALKNGPFIVKIVMVGFLILLKLCLLNYIMFLYCSPQIMAKTT